VERRGCSEGLEVLEFRLDSLPKPAAALPRLKEFLAEHREVTRSPPAGAGTMAQLRRSLNAEIEVLSAAAEAGCQIVDLELSRPRSASRQLTKLRLTGALL